MYAFVLTHFGSNVKYLEYEIYLLINLKSYTKHDIIYMYSITDTPKNFVNLIKPFCSYVIPYDDNNITYNVNFESFYGHFNLIRTCNYIFAYNLTNYKKICLIESDMIIIQNIDAIFELKTPSILINKYDMMTNYKLSNKSENFAKLDTNGGILLIKPSVKKFKKCVKNIKYIVEKNYKFPNEMLFLHTNKKIYNLPYKFNVNSAEYDINLMVQKYSIHNIYDYIVLLHFKCIKYKHIDIIKDGFLKKYKTTKPILYHFLKKYKKKYYDKYNEQIMSLFNNI
jgi:hypothetical protein